MTIASSTRFRSDSPTSGAVLDAAAKIWFASAAVGQGAFIYFILAFYYGPTLGGDFAAWNRKDLITGYVAGDHAGNLFFAVHVIIAALITASGMLQLVPGIRRRATPFHRWNGRFYIAAAFLMALDGLWLSWVRGTYLTLYGLGSGTILALLILASASLTLRYALKRDYVSHGRWALRTFLLVNGVWFQRVGYMAWILVNQGPVGIGKHMDGPFDIVLGFAEYVIPLAILEVYFRAKTTSASTAKLGAAALIGAGTVAMAIGIFGTWTIMWRPLLVAPSCYSWTGHPGSSCARLHGHDAIAP